jgi:hypothetical protein
VALTVLVLSNVHTTATRSVTAAPSPTTTTVPHAKPSAPTTTTTTVPPAKVPVVVANASGITGAAAALSARIQASGWDMLPPANATSDVTTSRVYYQAGFQPEAASIASSLGLPASAVVPYTSAAPVSSIGTAEVIVVAGPDISGNSTTTTAP